MILARAFVCTVFFAVFVLFSPAGYAETATGGHSSSGGSQPARSNDVTFSSGYAWGELKRNDDIRIIPFSARVGIDINEFAGLRGPNILQLGIEPFVNTIIEPDEGIEAGLNIGFRYIAPLTGGISVFGEISSGPAYLSIDTVEQGDAGFNFISQFGAGFLFALSDDVVFNAGYRFRHLSNANLSSPNDGIDTNYLVTGFSFTY